MVYVPNDFCVGADFQLPPKAYLEFQEYYQRITGEKLSGEKLTEEARTCLMLFVIVCGIRVFD
jgi:hypothetical protein